MSEITIKIPKYFSFVNLDPVLELKIKILSDPKKIPQKLTFDFSETEYPSMLGILLISHICDELIPFNCKCFAHYGEHKKNSLSAWVLKTMGLVKETVGAEIQEYLNTFRVDIQRCLNGQQSLDAVNKLIPIVQKKLNPSEVMIRTLNWALWELIDNAGVHGYKISTSFNTGYPKPVYFCAYDFKKAIDIAILDSGQGICSSFINSGIEKYKKIDNKEALLLSIMEHESSSRTGSPGFGLFGCAEIARQSQGKLVIISGSNRLILDENGWEIVSSSHFDGTMVLLSMPRDVKIDLAKILGSENIFATDPIKDLIGDFNE